MKYSIWPYFKFVKIEHTLFSLPIVFAGSYLARNLGGVEMSAGQLLWIFLAVLGARSAGFGLNRIVDREIDAKNPRTKDRELPAGKISVKAAWVFTVLSSLLFIFSSSRLAALCFYLSFIPLFFFALYPYLKRWTPWCHLGLGLAWGIAPLGGWVALSPQITPLSMLLPAFLLSGFCIFWVAGFDIIYAALDENFDRENGIHSMPARFGFKQALRVARIFHFTAFLFLGHMVHSYFDGPAAYALLAAIGALFIASHWRVSTEALTPPVVDFAFFKANAVTGFLVFILILSKGF